MSASDPPPNKNGYHDLASLMTRDPNLAVFRRFDFVNMLSLLSLQAEIQEMLEDFRFECKKDRTSGEPRREMYARCFKRLREAEYGATAQYQKLKELRERVKEYNALLLQTCNLNSLDAPEPSQIATLRGWLADTQGGANFLKKSETRLWEPEDGASFVRVGRPSGEHDMFTRFVSWLLESVLQRYFGLSRIAGRVIDPKTKMVSLDDSRLATAVTTVATVVSSTFPVLAILILYIVKNTYARIGITAGFTALFAVFLASFSSARRVEIFAATATFAAIEVVFIGSAISPGV